MRQSASAIVSAAPPAAKPSPWDVLTRKNVLAGLLFMAVAALGLWVSRDYPVGTALRMGTGYVPRLLCWVLLALGALRPDPGLRAARAGRTPRNRPPGARSSSVTAAWCCSPSASSGSASSSRSCCSSASARLRRAACGRSRPLLAALVLIVLSWAIFIVGLGLTIPVWPEW